MRLAVAALVCLAATRTLPAQQSPDHSCTRVAFGAWTPPLDWNRAGHPDSASRIGAIVRGTRDSVYGGAASASGRDEMQWEEVRGVRRLFLSPAWWPAGVMITFARVDADADTLIGEAVALVADGGKAPPRAEARLLRKGCPSRSP